jgi:non-ribosomal peptide synthetase component E (peptide arylation enzyme)
MRWIRESKYHMTSGPYTICKYFIKDEKGYHLFYKNQMLETGPELNLLKKIAKKHS